MSRRHWLWATYRRKMLTEGLRSSLYFWCDRPRYPRLAFAALPHP